MHIVVNGRPREVATGSHLSDLLDTIGVKPDRCAVEHNGRVLALEDLESAELRDGDALEIVHFVGGG